MKISNNRPLIFLFLLIILLGAFLRFYKLDWGNGLFAHPDEYHIVISVNQLSFPTQMNPHFFSYGTVVIYSIYFTKLLLYPLSPFLIGRFYSALFSTLTLIVIYKISRHFLTTHYSLLTTFLVALTPGLIQQAHFLTPESALIFFLFSCLYFSLKYLKSPKLLKLVLASLFLGLALGVKISALPFILVPILAVLQKRRFSQVPLIILIPLITLILASPFIFLDFSHFRDNLVYESSLATGQFDVFYTRQFINTTPFLFQLEKIYPYALGPALLFLGMLGLLLFIINIPKKPQSPQLLLVGAFFLLLIPNCLLFAKWTRFISPTFPFFALFAAYPLKYLKLPKLLMLPLIALTLLWSLAFFSIYTRPDVRVSASDWIIANLPKGSRILVEGGNTVDIPLSSDYPKLSLDFYNLDSNPFSLTQVRNALVSSDYFILESRRVFKNHQRLPHLFPNTANLYHDLFSGKLGFREIKEFTSFPKVLGLQIPDEEAEETWSVFDHPVIRIFKKI